MRNIHNQNGAELPHYIIAFYTQELGICFGDTGILVQQLFFLTFETIASPLNLESSWQPRYFTVLDCLMEWPAKDLLIFLKPLTFEKRIDLVLSSPKSIDSLLSRKHWHSDEDYLSKTFPIFLTSLCWQKIHVPSAYKQEPASDNDWGRSFTYNRKRIGPRNSDY